MGRVGDERQALRDASAAAGRSPWMRSHAFAAVSATKATSTGATRSTRPRFPSSRSERPRSPRRSASRHALDNLYRGRRRMVLRRAEDAPLTGFHAAPDTRTSMCWRFISTRAARSSASQTRAEGRQVFDFVSRTTPTGGTEPDFLRNMMGGLFRFSLSAVRCSQVGTVKSKPTADRLAVGGVWRIVETRADRKRRRAGLTALRNCCQCCLSGRGSRASSSATILVILIAGFTAGPAVSL